MYRIPKHLGVIPDGNRRWAQKNNMNKQDGYNYGLSCGLELLQEAKKLGIRELTYYGFTVDNCKRPKEQVAAFSKACVDAAELIKREGADLYVIGNTHSPCFPDELKPYTVRTKSDNSEIKVNLLVNYGWEWDLKNGLVSRDIPRIDLVIRWGGMCRLSGFLPVQTVYSDLCILNEYWPEYRNEQLHKALNWYQKQDVTLGG